MMSGRFLIVASDFPVIGCPKLRWSGGLESDGHITNWRTKRVTKQTSWFKAPMAEKYPPSDCFLVFIDIPLVDESVHIPKNRTIFICMIFRASDAQWKCQGPPKTIVLGSGATKIIQFDSRNTKTTFYNYSFMKFRLLEIENVRKTRGNAQHEKTCRTKTSRLVSSILEMLADGIDTLKDMKWNCWYFQFN